MPDGRLTVQQLGPGSYLYSLPDRNGVTTLRQIPTNATVGNNIVKFTRPSAQPTVIDKAAQVLQRVKIPNVPNIPRSVTDLAPGAARVLGVVSYGQQLYEETDLLIKQFTNPAAAREIQRKRVQNLKDNIQTASDLIDRVPNSGTAIKNATAPLRDLLNPKNPSSPFYRPKGPTPRNPNKADPRQRANDKKPTESGYSIPPEDWEGPGWYIYAQGDEINSFTGEIGPATPRRKAAYFSAGYRDIAVSTAKKFSNGPIEWTYGYNLAMIRQDGSLQEGSFDAAPSVYVRIGEYSIIKALTPESPGQTGPQTRKKPVATPPSLASQLGGPAVLPKRIPGRNPTKVKPNQANPKKDKEKPGTKPTTLPYNNDLDELIKALTGLAAILASRGGLKTATPTYPNEVPRNGTQFNQKPDPITPPTPQKDLSCQDSCVVDLRAGQQRQNQKMDDMLGRLNLLGQGLDLALTNAQLSEINNKLGPQIPNGGIGGKLQAMQNFAEKAWRATKMDKVLNLLTLITVLHNGAMLSRSLFSSLGDVTSEALRVFGIKDAEDNPIDVNEVLGKVTDEFIGDLIGEDVWKGTKLSFAKLNRIVTTASNIVWTVRSIGDSAREVAEWTGENVGKIGNSLKRSRVIPENAFPWMPEKINSGTATQRRWKRIIEGTENLDDAASSLQGVLGEVNSTVEEFNELKEQKQEFEKALKEADRQLRPDNDKTKADAAVSNAVSKSPAITESDKANGNP